MKKVEHRTQRKKLDWIGKQLGVQKQMDWYRVTSTEVKKHGGKDLLDNVYNGSLYTALKTVYSEFHWNPLLFHSVPKGYWDNKTHHRQFMDWISEQLDVQTQEDWYSKTSADVKRIGGERLLDNYYKGSLFSALQCVYPEFIWNPFLCHSIPHNHQWKQKSKHRELLDWIAEQLGIDTQSDWHSVTMDDVVRFGGTTFWSEQFNSALFTALTSTYKEFCWNPFFFTPVAHHHGKDITHQRHFMEWLGEQLDITERNDWYNITADDVHSVGGSVLIDDYFEGSLYTALKTLYPEHEWNSLLFLAPSKEHFQLTANQRTLFDYIADNLGIEVQSDWYDVDIIHVYRYGGEGVLNQLYDGSLYSCLRELYPEYIWDPFLFRVDWRDLKNWRIALDWIAQALNINTTSEWHGVTLERVQELSDSSILVQHFQNMFSAVSSVYPEFQWELLEFQDTDSKSALKSHKRKSSVM